MKHFWDCSETIPDGLGFEHFDEIHLIWLGAFAVFTLVFSFIYKGASPNARRYMRYAAAALLIADELFKIIGLATHGNYHAGYLPLHLCSINIFAITVYAIRPSKLLGNFLYMICIPAAVAALLFLTWTGLPPANFMHIHSFTVHVLLAAIPIILTIVGEIKPSIKYLPGCLAILLGGGAIALVFNLIFDTNFMFLMSAPKGSPLYWFAENTPSHLIGFPVIIAGILIVMLTPFEVARRIKNKKTA